MNDQQAITAMFDGIAPRYDLLNRLLSFHLDTRWRKKTSRMVKEHLSEILGASSHQTAPTAILDVATGTADLALQLSKDNPEAQVTGIDLSLPMLEIGNDKIQRQRLEHQVHLQAADAQHLPFPDHSFDAVTCAFGVRNFEALEVGLQEMRRVTKDNGIIAILEFSMPTSWWIRAPYQGYTRYLLPLIGRMISGHKDAYTYLPESIKTFSTQSLTDRLLDIGFPEVHTTHLCGGVATIYIANLKKNGSALQ
ncbi:MAG: bifunctional demethylmenaquinone methyltransferase/2-methoxy-6-polyprenyl-1,4-benzoquinol methylase UbiE [Bacteroidales bacterium]|nr:bifunctional demethylmenaquinone methyltransferase/2-methoxy-6-polyprenyl-1,4-benzoquinol methylase UbiE [Bacteroidales bacterium]